jgi:hypothetical protein
VSKREIRSSNTPCVETRLDWFFVWSLSSSNIR